MTDLFGNLDDLSPEQRELLALLLEEQGIDLASQPVTRRKEPGAPAPLSFAQQRLWFLDQLEPGSPMYNMPAAARLRGTLSLPTLQAALDEIAARHEVLRTVFVRGEDGEPVQCVLSGFRVPIETVDLSALSPDRQEPELVRLATAEAQRPFDLSRGPLARVTLLSLAPDDLLLLVNMHHIVTDGWSIGVFLRELGELYAAFERGQPSPLSPLPLQYGDYALWQRDSLQGPALDRQLAFWRDALAAAPAALELPFDRPRPAAQTYNGAAAHFTLPARLQGELNRLAQREGATLFMTLLSAFQVLLYRYSRQTDILVGTPIANRTRGELEGLIGFFANTLVIRGRLTPRMTYREFLAHVRETTLAAYEHQDAPFEQVVDAVQPERTLSYAPLFQVMFVLQNTPSGARRLPGMALEPVRFPSITAKFDLTLNMSEGPDGIDGSIEYNTDLFDAATIERFIGHFAILCDALASAPDTPVGLLPLLSAREQARLLEEWNATSTPVDLEERIEALFHAQADRTPDAIALVFADERLTYAQLDRRANRLAHHLAELGVGPESLVGVCMERVPDLIVALLAVLKAGAAYVPMDPRYPRERLEFMAEDAAVAALITGGSAADAAPANALRIVNLDRAALDALPDTRPAPRGGPGNLSYVLFTSGSTGRPKGVAIQHRSAIALIRWAQRVFSPDALAAVLASTSISFDLSVYEIFLTLSVGGRLILVENALGLLNNPAVEGVTLINTVPSAAAELLRLDGIPPTVNTVNLAGEPLSQQLVGQLYALPFVRDVFDLYGPTEDTTYSTYTRRELGGVATIGRPIDNTAAYLLDEFFNPVPQGVAGEVYLGGAGLARGYLNRPDLTAERFIPDPFATQPGARMYRTGDLARYLPDGRLQYLGRIDHQVKLRGFRIELGEIEKAIESADGIAKALVTVREDEPGNKQLVAYVERADRTLDGFSELRADLAKRLPGHMNPALFVPIVEWPLTPNGKIDRRRLPAPESAGSRDAGRYIAPRTPVEETVAGIFAAVLRVERAGVDDDFFHLGGHSLLATQLVSRVRQAFGVDLPLRDVFVTPTVGALAAKVEAAMRAAAGGAPPPIRPAERAPDAAGIVRLPLSFAQQRLWFLEQLDPGGAIYNIPAAVRLAGALDPAALEAALNAIVARHDSLRTTFGDENGRAFQVIHPAMPLTVPRVDLSGEPFEQREPAALELARADAARPFDLARGPLIRCRLIRLAAEDHVLLLCMHHIISDGWSVAVLIREFAQLYQARLAQQPAAPAAQPLRVLPLQYADYAVWQRAWLDGRIEGAETTPLQRQLGYWREQLAGLPALIELPADRPRPPALTYRGGLREFQLPADLSDRVREFGRREGATLFMTLLAALESLLHRLSGQDDFAIGSPVAGRNHAELESIIGFFVNTLVLRSDLRAAGDLRAAPKSFRELVARVRQTSLDAYAHQDVPFEMLVGSLDVARSASHTPLFQVMLTLQNIPGEPLRLPGLTVAPFESPAENAKFDLNWTFIDDPSGLRGALEYSSDLFDPETAGRFAACFVTLLAAAVAQPEQSLATLPVVPEADRALMFRAWNETRVPIDTSATIHARFEAQARRAPDALAVVAEQELDGGTIVRSLSYGELNRRANQLARRLRSVGVGPESIVGLTIERTTDLLVGVMGILKAGAAYLPLDPSYPADRLAFMLADSGARVLVTYEHFLSDAQSDVTTICLDRDRPALDALPDDDLAPLTRPDNIAYVIYTSGSTGRPKGVTIPHRAALNLAGALHHAAYRHSNLGRPLRLSVNAPLAFDASVQQLVMLTQGHTLHLVPQDARGDGAAFLAFIRRHRLDQFDCVPSQLKLILDAGLLAPGGEWTPSIVFPGGEAIDDATWATLAAAPATDFYNMYGPTECAVDSTTVSAREAPARATIGRPMANVRAYVLDRNLQPVPVGVPGELFLAGDGVGRGYLGRPDLTAERFLPDPFAFGQKPGFSEKPGFSSARMYRTGDLVRWTRDGLLEFLGRVDFQVKVRGFRIELGEIEDRLAAHPSVRQAVVLAREIPGGAGGKQLVAYLTPATSDAPSVSGLRQHLAATLPDYMVPAIFVTLDEMPLTPNRKIDRKALPAPEAAGRVDTGAQYVEPSNPAEKALAAVWSQVLGVTRIGAHDNFFELGGDSILSIQVVSRANQAGLNITPKQLFQAPTLSALAALAGTGAISAAEQGAVTGPVALTPVQRRFFELDLANRNHWNQSVLLSVAERLEPASLQAAVEALAAHHDALRLRFTASETGWQARHAGADEAGPPPFEWLDLSAFDDAAFSAEVERRAAEAQAALDIADGPLFRALYFDAGEGRRGRLFLVIHHLAVDGVSWRILLEDLQTAYAQHRQAGAIRLPPKTVSFKAWSEKLTAYAQSDAVRAELDDWLARVSGWITPLPVDNACDPADNTELSAAQVAAGLSPEETAALLTEANAAYNTEVPDLLLCALAQTMEKWTGEPVLYAHLEGHGREEIGEEIDVSRTVGWFTTLYPVRIDLPWDAASAEALVATKEQLRAVPQRGLGYGLLRYLGADDARAALAAVPEPEMTFNYLGQFDQVLAGNGPSASAPVLGAAREMPGRDRAASNRRDHLLDVAAAVAGGRLSISWTYSRAAHAEATVQQLADWHVAALRELIAHCRSPEAGAYTPSDFPLAELDQKQLDKVLQKVKTQGSEGTR